MAKDKNDTLTRAKEAQEDEFYTQYEDISSELVHYAEFLRGKRIICPCDWDESLDEAVVYANEEFVAGHNLLTPGGTVKIIDHAKTNGKVVANIREVKCAFVKFLVAHAEDWGIESIAVSGYNPETGEGVRFQDIDYSKYDVVITNPPFSQFRELIDTLFKNNMEFLVIGNQNAITYKECFTRIMNNEMWLGYNNGDMKFKVPENYKERKTRFWIDETGQKWRSLGNISWYTNFDIEKRHDEQILTEKYSPDKYPPYDNYDAIEVKEGKLIPFDYEGVMGVPITWLPKHNPDQFEIVGITKTWFEKTSPLKTKVYPKQTQVSKTGKESVVGKLNDGAAIKLDEPTPGETYYKVDDDLYKQVYARILIRNKHPYIEKESADGE